MSAHFLDILQGLTTLKLFNRSRDQVLLIRRISEQHRDATWVLRVAFLSALVLEMVARSAPRLWRSKWGCGCYTGAGVSAGAFFVLTLAPEFYLPLRMLGTRFHAGVAGVTAAQRIFEVLETPVAGPSSTAGVTATQSSPSISLRDVSVAFGDRSLPALDGVSFDIAAGERVALVRAERRGEVHRCGAAAWLPTQPRRGRDPGGWAGRLANKPRPCAAGVRGRRNCRTCSTRACAENIAPRRVPEATDAQVAAAAEAAGCGGLHRSAA
jgi:hypothetical protein